MYYNTFAIKHISQEVHWQNSHRFLTLKNQNVWLFLRFSWTVIMDNIRAERPTPEISPFTFRSVERARPGQTFRLSHPHAHTLISNHLLLKWHILMQTHTNCDVRTHSHVLSLGTSILSLKQAARVLKLCSTCFAFLHSKFPMCKRAQYRV